MKNPDGSEVHEREKMIEIANLVLDGGDTTVSIVQLRYLWSGPKVN